MVPALAESRLRFGGIDWSRTKAFSEELNYAPSIWLNQTGREPEGIVWQERREEVLRAIEDAALALRSPAGDRLVGRVVRREELHRGPLAHLFPDVSLVLHRPGGFTPACLPSRGRSGEVVVTIPQNELLGRKGRSLPGCHTDQGVLFVAGAGVEPGALAEASLEQVAPTVAAMAGARSARWFSAPIHPQLPRSAAVGGETKCEREGAGEAYSASDEQVIAERLRRLGYLE